MDNLQEFIREAEGFFHVRRTKWRATPKRRRMGGKQHGKFGPWNLIGNGCFGEAWQHQEYDFVLKISGGRYWTHLVAEGEYIRKPRFNHDAWQEFAKHCEAHPHPNLPKIHKYVQHGDLAWAVMPFYHQGGADRAEHVKLQLMQYAFGYGSEKTAAYNSAEPWVQGLMLLSIGKQLDIHNGNIRMDLDNDNFIITDPFSDNTYGTDNGSGRTT